MDFSAIYIRSFRALMDIEGGYVDHAADPGGATKYGISKLGYPDEDIANLTEQRAMAIYHRDYWQPLRLDALRDPAIAAEMFETAVILDPPGRPARATKIAQGALILLGRPISYDGVMGPQTINALNEYPDKASLLKLMNGLELQAFLFGAGGEERMIELVRARLQTLNTFLRGWLRRIAI